MTYHLLAIKGGENLQKELLNIQLASIIGESPYSDRKQALFFIHDFNFNENKLCIPEELCSAINPSTNKPYYDSLNGAPLVCATNGFDLLDHEEERDRFGNIIRLNTESCGTLFDAHIGTHEIDGKEIYGLWASAYIWTRFSNVLDVIQSLFDTYGSVASSVEVAVGGYKISEEGRTAINSILYIGHCLLGSTVNPAYTDSAMYELNIEVAEAFKRDITLSKKNSDNITSDSLNIENTKGGKGVENNQVEFNFGKEVKFNFEISELNSEMSLSDISSAVWNALHPVDENGDRAFKFWTVEVFQTFVIVEENATGKNYKVNYSVNSDKTASLDTENAVEVEQVWQEVNITSTSISISEKVESDKKIAELEAKISELNSEIEEKKSEISELTTKIEDFKKELSTRDDALKMSKVESNEKIIKLGESIEQLKTQINELQPIKKEHEKLIAEKQEKELNEKRENLKSFALSSKVIEEKEFEENEIIKKAIIEANEATIKGIIADRIVDMAKIEVNNDRDDDVVINSMDSEKDLVPLTLKEEMFKPRN